MKVPRRIKTLDQLAKLAAKRKAVTYVNWSKPCSAAFLMNMQVRVVHNFISRGLFEYRKDVSQ